MVNYIIVTGGVLSGLGKGVVTSSIGNLLKAQGYKVSPIKIDPYLNIDAGTMRPTEHGEVWVTPDGGETDQDLGNYERFMDIDISKENNITTGKVYSSVIRKERNLEFGGRCVQVIPHIPLEVINMIDDVARRDSSDFVIIELGGVVGDYENLVFLEAIRRMKLEKRNLAIVHVVYLPVPGNIGEMKTKPAQHSVRELNQTGIQPDFIVARGRMPIDDVRREKISVFCNVAKEDVISSPDVSLIYEVPVIFEHQGFAQRILDKFDLTFNDTKRYDEWKGLISKVKATTDEVKIGIVGKYFDIGDFSLEDSYISVIEAVKHAGWHNGVTARIGWIDSKTFEEDASKLSELNAYDGIIVPGGFGGSGVEGKISAIKYARENDIPFLGLCYGFQLAVVEFSRSMCGLSQANTTENDPGCGEPVIDILPEQKENIALKNYGATMRLGNYEAVLDPESFIFSLYGKGNVVERHRHRYEVNPDYIEKIESSGLKFSGKSADGKLMEFLELPGHSFFCATQAHPEFTSRPLSPNPLFNGFVKAAARKDKESVISVQK